MPAQRNLLNSYFGDSGINYNIVRVNMAGCDFSVREYTYLDTADDYNLNTFALAPEDIEFKIPILNSILKTSSTKMKLFASPWTAPNHG